MAASLTILEVDHAMADLDQTEICQLKDALDRAEDIINCLEELKDVDQTQIVQLQAHIDELGKTIEGLQEENSRLKEQNQEILGNTQEPCQPVQGSSSHHRFDISRTAILAVASESASAPSDEDVAVDMENLNMDDAVKDGYLSVSDSGFEDVSSETGSDSI
ncbi:hypothetical protein HER10_EVM0008130 [Colletotrichum scovillei]|uniref:Uncharacterized protein n=1 Tax=Colletotrichum scovillei TaxID=1209932 RepID=A0A9P7R0C6_9PEZI|nr:uncharacterized protein HER10_EVM0008130 [Colletotrichum scovillei]KAF4779960.1 hypothetical protein HER10_EVM0008130 [Colletotrichum scovillei]KAG7047115.1 hypothetical protein JMJ77_0015328 [Colletotrichum scovillei]KAG7056953.1 hypothetical protein JMJ78_0000739 [Colletotrichum scovillei]KAG7066886.1 hypothetical protein JMJ76_0000733 [Colletotrichum scovillei]